MLRGDSPLPGRLRIGAVITCESTRSDRHGSDASPSWPASVAERCGSQLMTRREILRRYRHLRAIVTHHHSAALKFLTPAAIIERARGLGLAAGQMLITDNEKEATLLFDLAIYAAREGRSRAIDRYARAARLPAGSDEALMLEAMRHARFSLWRIERRHDVAGLVLTDLRD